MGNSLIALFFAVGAGTWIYAKLMKNTGGNQRSSIIASGLIAVLLFVVGLVVLNMVM